MSGVVFSDKALPGCIGFGCLFWIVVAALAAAIVKLIPLTPAAQDAVLKGIGTAAVGIFIAELVRRNRQRKWPFNK